MKVIKLTQGYSTIVDDKDFYIVKKYKWHAENHLESIRVYGWVDGKSVTLSNLLLNPQKGMEVDHINGNPLDNRRENLRVCTHAENMFNKKIYKNNSSGIKGIYFDNRKNRWCAQLIKNNKKVFRKTYKSKTEASEGYKNAAHLYFGKYERL